MRYNIITQVYMVSDFQWDCELLATSSFCTTPASVHQHISYKHAAALAGKVVSFGADKWGVLFGQFSSRIFAASITWFVNGTPLVAQEFHCAAQIMSVTVCAVQHGACNRF